MQNLDVGSLLSAIRQRQLYVTGVASSCWAVVIAVSLLLIAMWLDLLWGFAPRTRVVALCLAAIAGVAALSVLVWRAWRRVSDEFAARQLDAAGGFGGTILSGWELLQLQAANGPGGTLSSGLSNMAIANAADMGSRVPASEAVSTIPAHGAAKVLLAIVTVVGLLVLCLPTLSKTQWLRFTSPFTDVPPYSQTQLAVSPGDAEVIYGQGLDVEVAVSGEPVEQLVLMLESGERSESVPMFPQGSEVYRASLSRITVPCQYFVRADASRSIKYEIRVVTVPRIESVRFRVSPPAYARDAAYEGPLPKDGLMGLPGTEVTIRARSNRPLSGGTCRIYNNDQQETCSLKPVESRASEVTGTFVIQDSGRLELTIADTEGQASQSPFTAAITLLEDDRPLVRLVSPRAMSLATPNVTLPVEVAAEDDYGVSRIQVYRSLNNSRPLPKDFATQEPPPRTSQQRLNLPLYQYGLQPGDEIKVFARAEDNDPAGAKGSESGVATVRIISQEEFEQMVRRRKGIELLTSKYQQAARRMERMAERMRELQERLAELPGDSPLAVEIRKAFADLAEKIGQEAQAIEESAKHLLPYAADYELTDELKKSAAKMEQAAKTIKMMVGNEQLTNQSAANELEQLASALQQQRDTFNQEARLPLEILAKVYAIKRNESRFALLAQRQRDLAERMAALPEDESKADLAQTSRMRDLASEQQRLQQELDNVLADIELHAEQLPDDPELNKLRDSALEFASAVRASSASDAMGESQMALLEFVGTRAVKKATKAADILEGFLSSCQGMGKACKKGCLAFKPSLGNCLNKTMEQLLAEAGLGGGSGAAGMGLAGAGGYSAQRNGTQAMGLYGGLPSLGPQGTGQGSMDYNAAGREYGIAGSAGSGDEPTVVYGDRETAAAGGGQESVPLRYRQRVSRYLQQLAEELDEP